MPTIEFDQVEFGVNSTQISNGRPTWVHKPLLRNINLTLSEHRIGVIGANGSGKSTLARLINGLHLPTAGTVQVDGITTSQQAKQIRRKVGFLFSDADNQILMPSVIDDVEFTLRPLRLSPAVRRTRAEAALERLDIAHLAHQSPHQLSGGEKQLLALAAILVGEPEVIVADEPTTLLDLRHRRLVQKIFEQLNQQLIVVTHDLEMLDGYDRVLRIDAGRVTADRSGPHAASVITDYQRDCTGEVL